MNAIRKKLLISSLQINFKYQKRIDGILSKFVKDEEKANAIKSSLTKTDIFEVLLHLIDTGDFFNYELNNTIIEIWKTLSNEQQQQIFRTMFSEENKKQTYKLLRNSCVHKLTEYPLGELLYDISFLNNLPGLSGENDVLYELISPEYQKLDYNRIIADDMLLDYYIKETDAFEFLYARNIDFSEEQLKTLLEKGVLWVIGKSQLRNDINFIENIIMKYPEKVGKPFIMGLPEEVKKNQRVLLPLLLSNSPNFDLLADKQTILDNLYLLKAQDKTSKMSNPNYICDKKLYILTTMNDHSRDGFINWHLGVDGRMIWDLLTEEEKNIFGLTYYQIPELEEKIDNIGLSIDSNSVINRMKFYKIMKINNEVLNLGISNAQIESVLNQNPNIINILAKKNELDKIAANNLYYAIVNDTLDVFLDFCDLGIATKVNMSLINKDLIQRVGYDIIRNVSLYPESFYYLLMLDKNGKLDIYKQMLKAVDNLPLDKVRVSNILLYTCTSFEKFIQQMIQNNELNAENILMLINMTQSFSLVDSSKCNSIKEYYEKSTEFCDKNILTTINPLISRELFCQRFFGSGYEQTIEFYDSFACSKDKINDSNIRNIFDILETLKNCEDIESIKEAYRNLQQANFKLDAVGLFALTEQLKKEIIGDLFVNSINNQNQNNIIDFTGKEFNCLIHVMGAYGATVPADNMYESWNSNIKIDNTGICTSLLNENYFGHARTNEHSVILGFDNISSSEIQLMGPYDLYSSAYGLETFSGRGPKYYNPNDLVNNTRAHHNEVVINRNLPGGQKRQPSYILCFDTINNESKKASEQFGIPIVFVDVKKHLEIKLQELETLKQSFVSTQSVETMKKIINMQETMRCGLLANNEELAQKIFSSEKITSNILFLIENSKELETLNELEILLNNEKDRVIDKSDHRNVAFNGDLDFLFEQLNIKKQKLSNSNSLFEFKNARETQMQQDQIVREQQLATLTEEMVETKEGHSLK